MLGLKMKPSDRRGQLSQICHLGRSYRLGTTLIVFMAFCVVWGCTPHRAVSETGKASISRGKTVVLPFIDMAKIYGLKASVRNPVTSKVFFTGIVADEGAGLMTNALYRMIGQKKGLVWGAYTDRSLDPKLKPGGPGINHVEQLRSIGRVEKAETVLAGYLYAFRDKTGGSYGVERPAQVAFEMVLINVDSGRIVWQRSFKETQKSLSEDLTKIKAFFKRGGRWVSAREMGENALQEMLKTLPQPGPP